VVLEQGGGGTGARLPWVAPHRRAAGRENNTLVFDGSAREIMLFIGNPIGRLLMISSAIRIYFIYLSLSLSGCVCVRACAFLSLCFSHFLSCFVSQGFSLSLAFSLTHTHTHTVTRSLLFTHSHTHIRTKFLSPFSSHTYTHFSLSLFLFLSLSPTHIHTHTHKFENTHSLTSSLDHHLIHGSCV